MSGYTDYRSAFPLWIELDILDASDYRDSIMEAIGKVINVRSR